MPSIQTKRPVFSGKYDQNKRGQNQPNTNADANSNNKNTANSSKAFGTQGSSNTPDSNNSANNNKNRYIKNKSANNARRRPQGNHRTSSINNKPSLPKQQTQAYISSPISKELKIIVLGGLGEFGRNMMLFEYQNKILIIDVGFRMPESDMPGIDYIIPNTAYLKGKEKNILGAVITHGHLDHIGAIPYCWHRLGNPAIFAGKLSAGLIQTRQEEFPHAPKLNITEVADGSKITLGPFKIEFFKQNHSIPDNFGLLIRTPVGNIVHTSDFKFDKTPVNGSPTDLKQLKSIGKENILLLMSDSTGAESEGHSLSERTIFKNLEKVFKESKGRIVSATFASHLNRVQQLISLSEKYDRKVILEGYSMKKNVEMARNLKYIGTKKGTIVPPNMIAKLPDSQISLLCTGAQGEDRAAFMRIANGDYRFLNLKRGDAIMFSSSVIPGNERAVQFLKDQFYRRGAKVYHYQMLDIHASGHAYEDELSEMVKLIKPKFFMPLHGNYSMMVRHAEIAENAGVKKTHIKVIESGQVISLDQKSINISKEQVPANYVMVDGLGIGDIGEVVLRDRQTLAEDGMFVVIAAVDRKTGMVRGSPDIISRGFVYLRESKNLLQETRKRTIQTINQASGKNKSGPNWALIKDELRDKIGEFLFFKTRRRPMILPVIIEV